jgi:hypothetical protein
MSAALRARSHQVAPGQWVSGTVRGASVVRAGYCKDDGHAPHATADKAHDCWMRYLIEKTLRLDGGGVSGTCMHPGGCEAHSEKTVVINGHPRGAWCDEHRTAENVTAWWNAEQAKKAAARAAA